ncbi:targeting protein for Xklp2 isoform X1 [Alosa alosa]|uniref:targeting protein for Xklp2 isoform X1 n=1 Tax=Alosa alosa TaxID=278164 RepID=UPI00201515FB|nr:targeting protein for Xklp2 isoform X1 [Alosa alosa]
MDVQPAGSTDLYEFDAPTHILDFKSLQPDDQADQWFDCSKDSTVEQQEDGEIIQDLTSPPPKEKEGSSDKEDAVENIAPSNIVLSWGMGKPAAAAPTQTKAQPRRVSKRPVAEVKVATPPVKKQRRVVPTPKRTFHHWRSSSYTQRQRRVVRSSHRLSQKSAASTAKAQTSAASATSAKQRSTEQQEMERIEALQHEVAEQRRRNEASYKAALAGSQPVKKQVLSTTIPKEFHFRSDARSKRSATVSTSTYTEVDFNSQLRKHQTSPVKAPPKGGTTVPKPFNLSRGGKRKHEESASYVSIAQQIEQFQKRTPVRYHLRSRQSQERGPSPVKAERPKVTHPMTPQLMTRSRSRPQVMKSTAEIEAEELEKIQQFKFKALELNRKILEAAVVPKKPSAKGVTQPEGFHLEIEKRLQERQASKKPKEAEDHTFHSKPLPVKILEEVVGVPEKRVAAPTVPESPAFALKNRVRVERQIEEVKPVRIKAVPVPHSVPFQPKLTAKSAVEMCPFSFEERERERRAMKEKKLEELRKEECHEFKATPLPDFSEISLPEKKVVEPTKPEPFRLQIDERGATKSDRWERMMKEELKQQAEAASFKARPNTVTHKEPFVPKKENRSILATEGFQLSTERRAKEREDFEREKSEREALRALQEQEQLREQEEQERERVARLRHELVHKAQPVRHYKQLEVKKSELPLTVPQSPNFSDRFRM